MGFMSSKAYLAALAAIGLTLVAGGLYEAKKAAEIKPVSSTAVFKVHCQASHEAMDDPIVWPGIPGNSHLHEFFGNTSVDAYSNTVGMSEKTSSCVNEVNEIDHSAYWFPALLANGVPIDTNGDYINAYYRAGRSGDEVTPFPYGLRMIAGDMMSTSPQLPSIAVFGCAHPGDDRLGTYTAMPTCTDNRYIAGTVTFPSCWDGEHLDSEDHKSHMAYPSSMSGCPDSHPVHVPQLTLRIGWVNTAGTDGTQYSLASGGQYSLHADFWNVWAPTAVSQLVTNCLNTPTDCDNAVRTRVTGDVTFPAAEWSREQ